MHFINVWSILLLKGERVLFSLYEEKGGILLERRDLKGVTLKSLRHKSPQDNKNRQQLMDKGVLLADHQRLVSF